MHSRAVRLVNGRGRVTTVHPCSGNRVRNTHRFDVAFGRTVSPTVGRGDNFNVRGLA